MLKDMFSGMASIKSLLRKVKTKNIPLDFGDSLEATAFLKSYWKKLTVPELKPEDIVILAIRNCQRVCQKVFGYSYYDVQILGGIALYKGYVAEIATGEGKTLCATLPAYFYCIMGKKVHIVTSNDYLAERDCILMSPLYSELGLTCSFITSSSGMDERMAAYKSDILYTTINELGFDYLRDNLSLTKESQVQCGHDCIIIDEADSILIDDSKTPLVLNVKGGVQATSVSYMNAIVRDFVVSKNDDLNEENFADVVIDNKLFSVEIQASGYLKLESRLIDDEIISNAKSLYEMESLYLINSFLNAVKAHYTFNLNEHYIVHDGEARIVNPGTGRVDKSKRWSGGLHQAIEEKEGLQVREDSIAVQSISLQNYVRKYPQICGMSGTVMSESEELIDTYGVKTIKIPSNKPLIRIDSNDILCNTKRDKYELIASKISELYDLGRPVLVGAASIQECDDLSEILIKNGIPHNVLNARNNKQEASIVSQSGSRSAVTIATSMAGRGTDIILGGVGSLDGSASEIKELGGLHVIGVERNESRRVDNQLIGRSGRQGDPGSSQFYCSLEDKIFDVFGDSSKMAIASILNMAEGGSHFSSGLINKAILKSQNQIDEINRTARNAMRRFDDVVNSQREAYFSARNEWLGDDVLVKFESLLSGTINQFVNQYMPKESMVELWPVREIDDLLLGKFQQEIGVRHYIENTTLDPDTIRSTIVDNLKSSITGLIGEFDSHTRVEIIRPIILLNMDRNWRDHLEIIESLKTSIHLRAYAQKTPLQEFSVESFRIFSSMINEIGIVVVQTAIIAFKNLNEMPESNVTM